MDSDSPFRQKGPGQVPIGQDQSAIDSNPSEESGTNVRIGTPVWEKFVTNTVAKANNRAAVQAENDIIHSAQRQSRMGETWKGADGKLLRKVGKQSEILDAADFTDHPVAGPEARKSLWDREVRTWRKDAKDAAFALRDPSFRVGAMTDKEREDALSEGSMLQETDPRHIELKSKLRADDEYRARKAELAQRSWDSEAKARELENTDPESWWQQKKTAEINANRQPIVQDAQEQHAQADQAAASAEEEHAAITAQLAKGVTGDKVQALQARKLEIEQGRSVIAGAKQAADTQLETVKQAASAHATADAQPQQEGVGDFLRGAEVSLKQIPQLGYGVAGLIGATMEKTLGVGSSLKDWGFRGYKEAEEKSAPLQRENDDVSKAWSKAKSGDVGALVDWAQYGLGYALGQLGETLAVSAIGGVAGGAAGTAAEPGGGTVVGGAGGAIAGFVAKGAVKNAAKGLIEKAIARQALAIAEKTAAKSAAEVSAENIAKLAASSTVRKAAAKELGSNVAVMANALGMEIGSIYPEAEKQAQSEGRELTGLDLARVWGTGIAAGGIEGLTDKLGIDLLKGKFADALPGGRVAGALVGGAADAAVEGGTEAVQTGIERLGASQSLTDSEAQSDYLNSAAMGAIGGAAVGGFGGAMGGGKSSENPDALHERISTAVAAIDPEAPAPTPDEITSAAMIANPNDGSDGMAQAVLIERELSEVERQDSILIAAAEDAMTAAQENGDKKAIAFAEANLEKNRSFTGRADTTRAVLKIAGGQQLDDLTDSELRAVGYKSDGDSFKPMTAAELKEAGITSPLIRQGADGSIIITDGALKKVGEISTRARARVSMTESEAIQKAKERAATLATPEASGQATEVQAGSSSPASQSFDVPMRDGTMLRVQAPDGNAALEEAAAQAPILGQPATPVSNAQPTSRPQDQTKNQPPASVPMGGIADGAGDNQSAEGSSPQEEAPANAVADNEADLPEFIRNTPKAPVNPGKTNEPRSGNAEATGKNPDKEKPGAGKENGKAALIAAKSRFAKAKKKLKDRLAEGNERATTRPEGITINPKQIIDEAIASGMTDKEASEYFNRVLDEEIRHLAQYDAGKVIYRAAKATEPFLDWMESHYAAIWQTEFVAKGKADDVFTIYAKGNSKAEAEWKSKSNGDKALEGIRIMSQRDHVTEAAKLWIDIGESLHKALKAALAALRQFSDIASPALKSEITNLENALKSLNGNQSRGGNSKTGGEKPTSGKQGDGTRGKAEGERLGGAAVDGGVEPAPSDSSGSPLVVGSKVEFERGGKRVTGVVALLMNGHARVRPDSNPAISFAVKEDALTVLASPADLKGEKINKEWVAYSEESHSLGIPRAEMPQIHSTDRSAMVQFLKARGIDYVEEEVLPDSLKPTQLEYSPAKVQKAREHVGGNRALLISDDGHLVDGHHQWMAALDDPTTPIRVIRLMAPIREILSTVAEMPSVETAGGSNPTTSDSTPEAKTEPATTEPTWPSANQKEKAEKAKAPKAAAESVDASGEKSPEANISVGDTVEWPFDGETKRGQVYEVLGGNTLKIRMPNGNSEIRNISQVEKSEADAGFNQAEYAKRKRALKKSIRLEEWQRVIDRVNEDLAYFEKTGYPDDWSTWQRAKDDAEFQIRMTEKPEIGKPMSSLTEAEQALKDAFKGMVDGLEASPLGESYTQGIPPEKIPQFITAAQKLIADGVTSAEGLAAALDKISPKLRVYSEAVWSAFRMVDPSLPVGVDWAGIYASTNQDATNEVAGNAPAGESAVDGQQGPPLLGTTGKSIWQGWKALQGVNVAPGNAVEARDVNNGGIYGWTSGGELMRLEKIKSGRNWIATMRPATKAEIEGLHESIDRGALQVEVRRITGAGGEWSSEDAGALVSVVHQATGQPIAEFLETPNGKAWQKRMDVAVAKATGTTQEEPVEVVAAKQRPGEVIPPVVETPVEAAAEVKGEMVNPANRRPAKEIKAEIIQRVEEEIAKIPEIKSAFSQPKTKGGKRTLNGRIANIDTLFSIVEKGMGWDIHAGLTPDSKNFVANVEGNIAALQKKAPYYMMLHVTGQKPATVEFSIPGDGTFKLIKDRGVLEEFLGRVKAMPVTETNRKPSASGYTTPQFPKGSGLKRQDVLLGIQDPDYRKKLVAAFNESTITAEEERILREEGVTREELNGTAPAPVQEVQAEAPAAPVKPSTKPKKQKGPSTLDLLENYFRPGKIVKSYGGEDRVISFNRGDGEQWSVTVQAVDDTDNRGPRSHSTMPSNKDLIRAWQETQKGIGSSSQGQYPTPSPSTGGKTPSAKAESEVQILPDSPVNPILDLAKEYLAASTAEKIKIDMPQRMLRLATSQKDAKEAADMVLAEGLKDTDGTLFPGTDHYQVYREIQSAMRYMERKNIGNDTPAAKTITAPTETVTDAAKTPESITDLDTLLKFHNQLGEYNVTADQIKAAWEQFKANEKQIVLGLSKLTMDELKQFQGMRRPDNKADAVRSAIMNLALRFNPGESLSFTIGGGDVIAKQRQALDGAVARWTDERIAELKQIRQDRIEARKKALENPETKDEWEQYVRRQGSIGPFEPGEKERIQALKGYAFEDAIMARGESKLAPEQLSAYDAVRGIDRKAKAQEEAVRKAMVRGVKADTDTEIIETKHTKTGADLFVVRLADRVEREVYNSLNAAAKKLGGYYSSYRGGGAVPGFQFKDRATAEQFQAITKGETVDRSEAVQELQTERKSAAAERLSALADRMDATADGILGADRKTNTAKRAREAGYQESKANGMKAMATTIRNLAAAIESGEATHLDGVTARTHVETLDKLAKAAKTDAERDEGLSYSEQEQRKYENPTPEQMAAARYPFPYMDRSSLMEMIQRGKTTPGAKLIAGRAEKINLEDPRQTGGGYLTNSADIETVRELAKKTRDWKGRSAWEGVSWKFDSYDRVQAMGLKDLPSLRAALREFTQYRGKRAKADPVKAMERELVGMKIEGFFPTPPAIIERMLEEAGDLEGKRLLEPSAGKGDIVDAAQRAGATVDAIEQHYSLRNILEAKGANMIGRDFMDVEPTPEYDVVAMNPPFENGQDAEHVMRAFQFLKPGGKLVAITGEGIFFRSDAKAREFRDWLDSVGGTSESLPEGSFKSAFRPTGVNTRMVVIEKPASGLRASELPTPEFRAASNLKEAIVAARDFVNQPITNLDDGLVATASGNAITKMTSQSATGKSVSVEAHAFAIANLDRLFENAIRTHSGPDERGDSNLAAVHRYYAPFQTSDGVVLAKLTVKEFARASEGSRIYSVEAVDVVKPARNWVASISEDRRNYTPQAGFEEKLRQKMDEIKGESEGLRASPLPESTGDTFKKRVPVSKQLTDEARRQQEVFGKNVSSGKLAGFGDERSRSEQDIVDAVYEFQKVVKSNADAMAVARKRLAADPADIEAKLLDAVTDKDFALDTADHLAMQMLINQRSAEAGNDLSKHADNMALRMAYRLMRGDVARMLQVGYDRNMTPAERALASITDAIYTPSKKVEKLAMGKPLSQRKAFFREAAEARVKQVESELRKMGVTLGEIMGENNKLKLANSEMMKQVAKLRKTLDQDILKMVQAGASIADIKRRYGKEAAESAQDVNTKAREELRTKIAPMIAAGMTMEEIVAKMGALSASNLPGSAKLTPEQIEAEIERVLTIGFGLPKEIPQNNLPRPRKPKPVAPVDTNPLTSDWSRPVFTDGLNSYEFDTKDRAGIMSRVESIRSLAGAMGKINTLTDDKLAKATSLLNEINGILAKYGTDAAGIFQAAKPIEDYRFNINDINHVSAIARAISAIDADWIDKASEVLYANMLSGLQTMAVNATAIIPAAWESTVGRGVEMAINLVVRDPMAAQIGEEKYILRALGPAITRAMNNFSASFTAQHPMFDRDVLNHEVDWDKILGGSGYRTGGSISGKKGDIVRIPMRILASTDDFNRTLMACVEVGTFAYRIAKAQGMKPGSPEFDRFLKVQVNTPGSMSYELAAQKASRAIFSNALPGQKDNTTGKTVPVNDIGDLAGWAAASLNKFASQQHENMFAKAGLAALRICFFPFQRTPFNILRKGVRYTLNPFSLFDIGLGIVQNSRGTSADGTTQWKWNAKGRNPELIERLGQQLQGAILMALLAATGAGEGDDDDQDKPFVITGSAPFTPQGRAEREAQMRSGIGPYRISFRRKDGTERFGFNYGRLEPLATTLAASIDLMKSVKRAWRGGKGTYDAASEALGGLASQAQDKSFMKGISDLVALVTNLTAQPDLQENRKFQQFLAGRVAMVIPNIIKQPIREADGLYRERSNDFMQELLYQIVPYGQKEAKIDPYGREAVKTGNPVGRVVDVTDAGTDKVHPIDAMLLRFRDKHPGDGWFPSPIVSAEFKHPVTGKTMKMNEAQLAEFRSMAGKRTDAILKSQSINYNNPSQFDIDKVKESVTKARSDMKKALAFKFAREHDKTSR